MNNIAISIKELIANQQIEIESLKATILEYSKACDDIANILYCVGGPLNDNKLEFNEDQLKYIRRISEALEL